MLMQIPQARESSLIEVWPRHKYVLKAISVESNVQSGQRTTAPTQCFLKCGLDGWPLV